MTAVALVKWEALALVRRGLALLTTARGLFVLFAMLLAVPSLSHIARAGALEGLTMDPGTLRGALALAHLAFMTGCAVFIATSAAGVFVVMPRLEPLAAMPWCARTLVLHRLLFRVILPAVGHMGGMFGVFWLAPLRLVSHDSWPFLAGYAVVLVPALVALSAMAFLASRLAWAHPGYRARGGAAIWYAGFTAGVMLIVVMTGLPAWLASVRPGALEAIGRLAPATLDLGQMPLAAAYAARDGHVVPLLVCTALMGLAAWAGVRGLRRWAIVHGGEMFGDVPSTERWYPGGLRVAGPASTPRRRSFAIFWAKDVWLSRLRSPARYLVEQWLVLGTPVVIIALGGLMRGSPELLYAQTTWFALMSAGVLAAILGLGSLGGERRRYALLRPVLTPSALFRVKTGVNAAFVAAHSVAYGCVIAATAAWAAPSSVLDGWALLSIGLITAAAGAAFTLLATGLGFLLPVFDGDGTALVPGGSRAGLLIYLALVLPLGGITAFGSAVRRHGELWGALVEFGTLLITVALGAGVATWANRRLARLEI